MEQFSFSISQSKRASLKFLIAFLLFQYQAVQSVKDLSRDVGCLLLQVGSLLKFLLISFHLCCSQEWWLVKCCWSLSQSFQVHLVVHIVLLAYIYRNSVIEQVGLCAMKVFSHFFNELNLDACASLMQCVLGSFRALIRCSLDGFEISLVCCMIVLRSMDFLCLVLWQWISELLSFPVLVDWMIISCK